MCRDVNYALQKMVLLRERTMEVKIIIYKQYNILLRCYNYLKSFHWFDGSEKFMDFSVAGWAHVVCALYIPEVRFGNVTTMEPIVLQMVPTDRFSKVCGCGRFNVLRTLSFAFLTSLFIQFSTDLLHLRRDWQGESIGNWCLHAMQ